MKLSEFKKNLDDENKKRWDFEDGTNRVEDLELILDVVKDFNSSLFVEDVLEHVLTNAIRLTKSDRGFIVLINDFENLEYKLGIDSYGSKLPEHLFNISTTVVDDVFNSGNSKFIESAQDETNNNPSKSILNLALQTILCSPLIAEDKKLGVIYVDSKYVHKINIKEITYTFEILAAQAAIAIRNAQLYEELNRAKEKAEESEKLKSAFLSLMSHEIRSPINTMFNFNALIQNEFQDKMDDEMEFVFQGMYSSGRRLIRTLDNILNMSSLQSGEFEKSLTAVDLNYLVSDVIKEFYEMAQSKHLILNLNNGVDIPPVNCDEYSISEIFKNLIDNALKYTKEGEVQVTIFNNESNQVCVEVKDTGIGISDEYMPKVFDMFSQEEIGYSRAFDGSGLGLALIKKFVEINNCEILVQSEKSVGSSFTVVFPS